MRQLTAIITLIVLAGCEQILGISDPSLRDAALNGADASVSDAMVNDATVSDASAIDAAGADASVSCRNCDEALNEAATGAWCCGSDALWTGLKTAVCSASKLPCEMSCGAACASSLCMDLAPTGVCADCIFNAANMCPVSACINDTSDAECIPENCTDNMDNDGDGDTDCADSDCSTHPSCACPADAYEDNDTLQTAYTADFGSQMNGANVCLADPDFYYLDGTNLRDVICALTIAVVPAGPVYVTVYDGSGAVEVARTLYTAPVAVPRMPMPPDFVWGEAYFKIDTDQNDVQYNFVVTHDCFECGDASCDAPEDASNCPADCP